MLEFLGLEEKPVYSESELETAIIDRLPALLAGVGQGISVRGAAEAVYFRQQSLPRGPRFLQPAPALLCSD